LQAQPFSSKTYGYLGHITVDQEVGGSNPPSSTSATRRKVIVKRTWDGIAHRAVKTHRKPMRAAPAEFGRGPNRPSRLSLIDGIAGEFTASIGHAQML
jgi:hypothetical protein